jgi:imidazolonepropionase-like amidohydrolase
MRFSFQRLRFALGVVATVGAALLGSTRAAAQGGEPQYFAIRGVTVVPVSGPRVENTTVIISRGVIKAVSKDAAIPDEAWVIEGKGLIVYPGFIDSFTDVGIPAVRSRLLRAARRIGLDRRPGAPRPTKPA